MSCAELVRSRLPSRLAVTESAIEFEVTLGKMINASKETNGRSFVLPSLAAWVDSD